VTLAPVEAVQITPSINHQSPVTHDTSAFYTYLSDPGSGVLKNGKLLDQPYADRYTSLSLKTVVQVGSVEFKAVTAYMRRHAATIFDGTNNSFAFWPNPLGPEYPVSYADAKPSSSLHVPRVVSHQVLLSKSDPAAPLTWVVGAGYVHAVYKELDSIVNSALSDGGFIDGATFVHRGTIQAGAYGQLDLHLQPRLTATVGARVERTSYESTAEVGGIRLNNKQYFTVEGSATPAAVHLGLSFQGDDRNLYYATLAKAYRMGGPNPIVGVFCTQTPSSYGPDSLWSFEVGAKNRVAGRTAATQHQRVPHTLAQCSNASSAPGLRVRVHDQCRRGDEPRHRLRCAGRAHGSLEAGSHCGIRGRALYPNSVPGQSGRCDERR